MTAGTWAAAGHHMLLHLILHFAGLAVLLSQPLHSFSFGPAYLLLFSLPEAAGGLITGGHVIPGLCVSLLSLKVLAKFSKETNLARQKFVSEH